MLFFERPIEGHILNLAPDLPLVNTLAFMSNSYPLDRWIL